MVDPTNSTNGGTERLLNITAAKGLLSCSITNRESTAISKCSLNVKDAEGVEWSVDDTRVVALLGPAGAVAGVARIRPRLRR